MFGWVLLQAQDPYYIQPKNFDPENFEELVEGTLPDLISCQENEEKHFKFSFEYAETILDEEDESAVFPFKESEWTEADEQNFENEFNVQRRERLEKIMRNNALLKEEILELLHRDLSDYFNDNWHNGRCDNECDRIGFECNSTFYMHFIDTTSFQARYVTTFSFLDEDAIPAEVNQFLSPTMIANGWVYFSYKCECKLAEDAISLNTPPNQELSVSILAPPEYSISVVATGESTGNAATLMLENLSDKTLDITFPPGEITSNDRFQGYISIDPIEITVNPGESISYAIPSMYCINIDLPSPPEGTILPTPDLWNPASGLIDIVTRIREEVIQTITEEELDQLIDGDVVRDLVTQELTWFLSDESSIEPSTICDRIGRNYETTTGNSISSLPASERDVIEYKIFLLTELTKNVGATLKIPAFVDPPLDEIAFNPEPAANPTHPDVVKTIKVTSTGETTGRIGYITITNPTDRTLRIKIGAGNLYMPVDGDQSMVVSDIPEFTLAPGETRTIPLEGSVCADITSLPVAEGLGMPPISEWIGLAERAEEFSGQSQDPDFVFVPTRTSLPLDQATELLEDLITDPVPTRSIPCVENSYMDRALIPGTTTTIPVAINPDIQLNLGVTLVLNAFETFTETFEKMKDEGKINTVMSRNPEQEKMTSIQWLTWRYGQALQQKTVKKEHFMNVSVSEIEQKGGREFEDYPIKQQELITEGLDGLWSVFDGVGAEAKILAPGIEIPIIREDPIIESGSLQEFGTANEKVFEISTETGTNTGQPGQSQTAPVSDENATEKNEYSNPTETTPGGPTPTYAPEKDTPICNVQLTPIVDPAMDGGLKNEFIVRSLRIFRDDFLPLGAEGLDYDQIKWECVPAQNCPDTKGDRTIPLTGKVKFEWEIREGEGNFVQVGCLPVLRNETGDHVIFQPPYVALEDRQSSNSKTTTIFLKIIDDNPTQARDNTVEREITITTLRRLSHINEYEMTVTSDPYTLPGPPQAQFQEATCLPVEPEWTQSDNLVIPNELKPGVDDSDKIAVGQWIRLFSQDQDDPDALKMKCESDNCNPSEIIENYEDRLEWEWEILTNGNVGGFVIGPRKSNRDKKVIGRYVIYEAPMKLEEELNFKDIEIKLKIKNPESLQLEDIEKEKTFTLRVYKAGIELARTPSNWLPTKNNSLDLTSELQYHDGTQWQDGLAHMCRIHFFDLVNNSRETGYCNNAPKEEDATKCYDYRLSEGDSHELFNERRRDDAPSRSDCQERNEYFLEARTNLPVREYTMTINSEDYGGYAKLLSLGNINKYDQRSQLGEEPFYFSIPVQAQDHPDRRRRKKEIYEDNRVTIPRDIDENMIADNGWTASIGNGRQQDPVNNEADEDNIPVGDGLNEDGYTAYEEYRGFDVIHPAASHVRTDLRNKDLLVWNEGEFSLGLFRTASSLSVHEAGEENFQRIRQIYMANFNSPTFATHKQAGIKIVEGTRSGTLLGIADTVIPRGQRSQGPAPPNWVREVRIYERTINNKEIVDEGFVTYAAYASRVAAHEIGHACNVYHHGEHSERTDISSCPPDTDVINGPRSGNLDCIMRYDNKRVCSCQNLEETQREYEANGRTRTHRAFIEPAGSIFCNGTAGTGYNLNNQCFRNCAAGRGNCIRQFRVSGRHEDFPNRR